MYPSNTSLFFFTFKISVSLGHQQITLLQPDAMFPILATALNLLKIKFDNKKR
ncbi:MAG: hypothetical protein K0R59_4004 [Sphingobacterium sp.]|jgi:hypothetical protein|nr:hypothetical protein [Sphingobacterium sp.]